jgi:hypothetical protein
MLSGFFVNLLGCATAIFRNVLFLKIDKIPDFPLFFQKNACGGCFDKNTSICIYEPLSQKYTPLPFDSKKFEAKRPQGSKISKI